MVLENDWWYRYDALSVLLLLYWTHLLLNFWETPPEKYLNNLYSSTQMNNVLLTCGFLVYFIWLLRIYTIAFHPQPSQLLFLMLKKRWGMTGKIIYKAPDQWMNLAANEQIICASLQRWTSTRPWECLSARPCREQGQRTAQCWWRACR